MQVCHNLGRAVILAPALFAFSLTTLPAQAANVVKIGHRVLNERILRDARDRYNVRFKTSRVTRLSARRHEITGQGSFDRRGKSSQSFTYHAAVDPREGTTLDLGYDVR
jgi:hypothetical protein